MSTALKITLGILGFFLICGCIDSCVSCASGEDEKPSTYVEAVAANDFKTAHEMLDRLHNYAIKGNANNKSDSNDDLERFFAAADHIYKAEMIYLIEMKDIEANKRLINTLAQMNLIGNRPTSEDVYVGTYGMARREENYSIFVTRFNRLCDEILQISILNKNKEMAEMIMQLYKEDCEFLGYSKVEEKRDDDVLYKFKFSTKSKDEAQKKLNDAINNGVFN